MGCEPRRAKELGRVRKIEFIVRAKMNDRIARIKAYDDPARWIGFDDTAEVQRKMGGLDDVVEIENRKTNAVERGDKALYPGHEGSVKADKPGSRFEKDAEPVPTLAGFDAELPLSNSATRCGAPGTAAR